jgi:type II secretory pathway component GspD/PulD (secretin)
VKDNAMDHMKTTPAGSRGLVRAAARLALLAGGLGLTTAAWAQTAEQPATQPPAENTTAETTTAEPAAQPSMPPAEMPIARPVEPPGRPTAAPVRPAGTADRVPAETKAPTPPGPDEVALSAFSEPVELSALVDFVAKTLGINVTIKGGLNGTVVFNAPVTVKKDRLLPLLDALLGQQNFTITLDPSGFYTVQPTTDLVVNFAAGATTRIINTPNVKPTALKPAIEAQFPTTGGRPYAYVDELGVVVATDTPRRLDALEGMVRAILAERGKIAFTRIDLVNIAAPVARTRVLELIGQIAPKTGQMNNPGMPQEQVVMDPNASAGQPGVTGKLSNLTDRLLVDAQGNALIFRGMPDEAEQVREVVKLIDVKNTLIPRSYFAGSAARQLADIARQRGLGEVSTIGDSLSDQNRNSPYGGELNYPQGGYSNNSSQSQIGGPVMVVDEGRGTIIYYGTDEQQVQLQALIKELDTESDRIVLKVYKLKHTDAETVSELINGLLTNTTPAGDSPLTSGTGTGFSGNRRSRQQITPPQSGNVTIIQAPDVASGEGGLSFTGGEDVFAIPDKSNNQVLIKAPGKQQAEFAKLIESIDLRRPQVYIECQIIALTATDDFRLAFETQLLKNGGDAVLNTNFGLSSFPTGAGLDSAKTAATGLSGLTAAIIKSNNVPLIINALQTVADTQILSSPSLLVDDNEEASINSVQQQPTTSSSQGTSTTETTFAGYEDAGTTLTIKPQISEGGYLRLKYEAKLSNFNGTGSNGIPAPKQENTVKSDSVTVPSDMAVVVGGLTLDSKSKTVVKVPILGDIPIIGQLFKDDNRNDRKTTLYIFLTPRILRDPNFADLRLLSRGPQGRTNVPDEIPELSPAVMPAIVPNVTVINIPESAKSDVVPAGR